MNKNQLPKILAVILFQALTVAKLEAATIFVDGMAPEITYGSVRAKIAKKEFETKNHSNTPYLLNSALGKTINSTEKHINWVGWSGNPTSQNDIGQATDKLKSEIIAFHKDFPNESINIVSHSYGTVIAYKTIEKISEDYPGIQINTFITMGSPLGSSGESGSILEIAKGMFGIPSNAEMKKPVNVKSWLNYYTNAGDVMGGSIGKEGIEDIELPGYGFLLEAHESYYKENANRIALDFRILATVSQEIAGKFFDSKNTMEELKSSSTMSSQQKIKDISFLHAIEYSKLLTTAYPSQAYIQPSDSLVNISPSQLKQATAQSLINTQTVYYTEKIVGSWLSDTLHGSGGGWLETLRFNKDGSYSVITSSGGQYSGTYSVIPSSDMGIYSTPKTLSFDVSQSNNGGGTLNQDVGYGRGLTIQSNKMTLQADIQNEKAMVDGYTKQ